MSNLRRQLIAKAMQGGILPKEYQMVEYLQTDGKCLIITDQIPSFNIAMHIKFRAQTGSNYLFQARDTNGIFGISGSAVNNTFFLSCYDTSTKNAMSRVANNIYEAIGTISDSTLVLDVTNITNQHHNIVEATHTGTLYTTANICLFGNTYGNYILSGVRIYYAGIEDIITKTNKCFYYPCYRKSDNEPGMYDIVSGQFFINQGTGKFTVGPDI